nr:zinc finger, CCHC-type [Tanacetum cinerariifolium]
MEDETLVRKLLNAVPDRYLQLVVSIEQYSDLSEMTFKEAIGRLKTYEERIKITETMNQPGIKEDIHCKNSKLEGGNNQKYDQPGLKEDHNNEVGNNQKNDQHGHYEDHSNKNGRPNGKGSEINAHNLFSTKLSEEEALKMVANVNDKEIKEALFDIGENRAPDPDGYSSAFFKHSWSIIGNDI